MKSLRVKNIQYFRNGYIVFPSINKAKANGFGIGGTMVLPLRPTPYRVFALDDFPVPRLNVGTVHSYDVQFQAMLDELQEIKDKLEAAKDEPVAEAVS